ncbi:sugar-transfer associated ATP-grasp domain-containing protein [Sphingomonas sp. BIUV-7]|uniref:Sugar-transfer associated ATP-grasp domain-containing protein n=1 Tax=Sphingomonas natans TaxID=3063330 RepID=A0ABT8YB91_9SPHN|nr:sugar-transfer associated ATP-grasp domain-containing protein [Sphingomonas sp. BIUV-7]MDO6414974.1 sugar-transfer associated ATP-grasp domain-containing protein [Sphingomonas sp. BIUV-7]
MLSATELWYRAKKAYSLYPGVVAPVSGRFLADHYARRRRVRGPLRAALDCVVGLGFLAWVPLRARKVQRRHQLDAAWRTRAIAIAREAFADPNDIALFRIEHPAQLNGYIRRFEDAGLNKRINPRAWAADCVLADKIAFYARCAAHGLPHPIVVATIAEGRVSIVSPPGGRPLLIKPARGEGGAGVEFVDGAPEDARAWAEWLHARFGRRRHAWLVQHRIAPHAALADLALNALPTARMTTILNEAGVPELVSAVLRIPSNPDAVVDNMKQGGLLSPIDLADGRLGQACKGYGGGDYDAHPVTDAPIPGRRLPDWAAAQALVADAHIRAFPDYALIGWDVGLSPDGPILIEGNGKPGVLMPQRAARRGLGGERYGALLAFQLARTVID